MADTILVLLLGLVVLGLLRSHADIARALDDLGAPLGDPARPRPRSAGVPAQTSPVELRRHEDGTLQMGPAIPPRAAGSGVFDLAGTSPAGDGLALGVVGTGRRTLLAFLSSGCASCGQFWAALAAGPATAGGLALPAEVRPVVVTKDADAERPSEVQRLAAGLDAQVIMSSGAWSDYEVPGSPFFVLVDGASNRRLGEGTARTFGDVAQLVRTALGDEAAGTRYHDPLAHRDHVPTVDQELAAAGLRPGDPSLYPRSMDDIVQPR